MTRRHSSAVSASGGLRTVVPELLTRMSSRPNAATVFAIAPRQDASSTTSNSMNVALAPSFCSSATAASALARLRAAIATAAPACAKPRAMPSPMPPLPPVTSATLPGRSRSFMSPPLPFLLHCDLNLAMHPRHPGCAINGASPAEARMVMLAEENAPLPGRDSMTAIRGYVPPTTDRDAIGVHSLDHFVLAVPDLKPAQDFYKNFGLDVREDGSTLGLNTYGHEHRWGLVFEGKR